MAKRYYLSCPVCRTRMKRLAGSREITQCGMAGLILGSMSVPGAGRLLPMCNPLTVSDTVPLGIESLRKVSQKSAELSDRETDR
jgi:hypothetical protein